MDDDLYEFGDYLGEPSSLSYHVDDMGYMSDLDDDDDFPGSCSLSYHGDNMDYISDLDDDCVPGMGKPSSRDGNTYDVSPPIPASECSSNQFPTAEKSIFSTTTTNHNFAFTDARSNYDNMNHVLFSYASNVIAAPCLTAAKQTFDAQSKLFDKGNRQPIHSFDFDLVGGRVASFDRRAWYPGTFFRFCSGGGH